MNRDTLQPSEDEVLLMSRPEFGRRFNIPLSQVGVVTADIMHLPDATQVENGILYLTAYGVEKALELTPPRPDWIRADTAAEIIGELTPDRTIRIGRRLTAEGSDREQQMVRRRPVDEETSSLFLSPTLVADIRTIIENRRERDRKRAEEQHLCERFEEFSEQLTNGETIEAEEFRKLVELFGPDSGFDLLMQYRPEFKDVPVDTVHSFLTDYLGAFIMEKGKLNLDNLSMTAEFLSHEPLKRSLIEVIKGHCLTYYQNIRRANPQEDDLTIISDHLQELRQRISGMNNQDLSDVLTIVEDYFTWLFVEIEKPENFVHSISGDRAFPDLGQRVNVGEIALKKRMLIADEPGTGKSASAIMAKEHVGAQRAVIVCPPSMVGTWQEYLSDKVDQDGRQIGYFQPGLAPRVLVVHSLEDIAKADPNNLDYVILSHNRLHPAKGYTQALKELGFDMLITDEAHELKNIQDGVRANELVNLSDYVTSADGYSVMLTATPAPNKVSDIAMVLRMLYPAEFGGETNTDLAIRIIRGDYINIRSLLVPRMQCKSITDTVVMPPLQENFIPLDLSKEMAEVYELLLEEDELTPTEKIQRIRQFLINPAILESTPDIRSEKAKVLGERLAEQFQREDKILVFVNDYVENVLRGDSTIQQLFELPENVAVLTITGETSEEERGGIRYRFQHEPSKILLLVSGNTSGIGVDLSAADRVVLFNEPWNKSIRRQEIGRAYRPGRDRELAVDSYYFANTLEEGIILYSDAKELAIQKLLHGIQLSQLEQAALISEEQNKGKLPDLNVNHELAAYYYSSWQRMLKMFGYVKEIGAQDFQTKFLPNHGKEYAETYRQHTYRSYQANAARLNGTIITEFVEAKKQYPTRIKILDIACGPEMLKKHVIEDLQDSVISLDINPEHFDDTSERAAVGSMDRLPVADGSIDYANVSLALHYTKQQISKAIFERAETLKEINRVLKRGGRAVLTMIYSYQIEDMSSFEQSVAALGFKLVKNSSGTVDDSGKGFKAQLIALEKVAEAPVFDHLSSSRLTEISRGLKLARTKMRLSDTRKLVNQFNLRGKRKITPRLNKADAAVLEEETKILQDMHALRHTHGSIADIPPSDIVMRGFSRIFNGQQYVLFSRLSKAIGAVMLR